MINTSIRVITDIRCIQEKRFIIWQSFEDMLTGRIMMAGESHHMFAQPPEEVWWKSMTACRSLTDAPDVDDDIGRYGRDHTLPDKKKRTNKR
jgi:hypothetical protein